MLQLPLGPNARIYIPGKPGCFAGAWLLSPHGAMQLGEYVELEGPQVPTVRYRHTDTVLLRAALGPLVN